MNCFDWQNRASDYLDGMLTGAAKTEADTHLDSCRECLDHYKHYRMLLNAISSQPRSSLPIPIRKSPLAAVLPRLDIATLSRSRWEQVPWYVRTSVEGTAIVLMILLGISAGPRLRALYERGVERSLTEFTQSLSSQDPAVDPAAAAIPLNRGNPATPAMNANVGAASANTSDDGDFASSGDDSGSSDSDDKVHVGSSEMWRINLKTDSPRDIRPRIVQILTDLHIPADTPGLGGVEVPGGIQFDLLVPQTVVTSIKKQIQALAPKTPAELADSPAGETFTWYMNKSKRKLPEHKTRIVIWLSQL